MEPRTAADRVRVALVDLDAARLDGFREALGRALAGGEAVARAVEVRLVVCPDADALPWRWAALAGVARAGEIAALSEVVVDGVLVAAESPRAAGCARLAATLGARVLELPDDAGDVATPASSRGPS
ncbi:MAG: hypothetical protein ABIP29_02965 [Candidatus Eisenbacteria bacterium]